MSRKHSPYSWPLGAIGQCIEGTAHDPRVWPKHTLMEVKPLPIFSWLVIVSLLGESQGWGSLVGSHLWGRAESDMTEATQQQQQQQ